MSLGHCNLRRRYLYRNKLLSVPSCFPRQFHICVLRAHCVLGLSEQGPPEEPIGDYSTDANGHCYFYGERLDSGRPSRVGRLGSGWGQHWETCLVGGGKMTNGEVGQGGAKWPGEVIGGGSKGF